MNLNESDFDRADWIEQHLARGFVDTCDQSAGSDTK